MAAQLPVDPALPVTAPPIAAPTTAGADSKGWLTRKRAGFVAGTLLVFAVAAFGLLRSFPAGPEARRFQLFWNPVLTAQEPLLVVMAHPIVYHPSLRAQDLNDAGLPDEEQLRQHPLRLPPNLLTGSDFIPVFNQYVGFGDLVAVNEISNMLARHSRNVRIRLASSVEFADLRKTQTLLIGGVTNRWTAQMQQGWRFRLKRTPEKRVVIADTHRPAGTASPERHWQLPPAEDGSAPEDYILICRIHDALTGGLTIVAAGLRQFGTEAAGRVLADPEQLDAILSKLPAGWESRNLQLVLHARVIGNAPAQPDLADSQVW